MKQEVKDLVNAKTGLGAGVGALLGFMFAGGPAGAAIGAMVGGAIANTAASRKKGVMTPKRKLIYERAMQSIKSPADLKKLSSVFAGEGLQTEASMLAKRAALREMPDELKQKRRTAFRKAMCSDDVEAISRIAEMFAVEGAVDAAKTLKDHGNAVKAAHAAGKSGRPQPHAVLGVFADKMAKAIMHFGPNSKQAVSAAANLIAAQGKKPTKGLIQETIAVAVQVMGPELLAQQPQEAASADAAEQPAQEEQAPEAEAQAEAPAADESPIENPGVPEELPSTGAVEPVAHGGTPDNIEQPNVATSPQIGDDKQAAAEQEAAVEEAAAAEQAAPQRMRVA